jgi:hypothetical protein
MTEPVEHERRRTGAAGTPVRLSDGDRWLLANPAFSARGEDTTSPCGDKQINRIFECVVLGEDLDLTDIWAAARELLLKNYELSEAELSELLSTSPGPESRELASSTVEAMFGSVDDEKGYCHWVRASLLANGLGNCLLSAQDLPNVLAVLVATNRTIPLSKFADACRLLDERARLGGLI